MNVQTSPEVQERAIAPSVDRASVQTASQDDWTLVIEPKRSLLDLNLAEVWRYRDLLYMFVRRDFVALYKQTILGPLWYLIQPLMQTVVFTLIFSKIAKIGTDDVPPILFYLAGITMWTYFSECLTKISDTFIANQAIFGKVYFPRAIVPLSLVVSGLIKFSIQFLLLMFVTVFFVVFRGVSIQINSYALLLPVLILIMAMLGLGFGMMIASMTSKYRDLKFLLTFGVQLWMYATPIVYPMSMIGGGKWKYLIWLNPLSSVIETFKLGFLGEGSFSWMHLGYSAGFAVVLFFLSLIVFNKTERNFMDTV